MKNEYSKKEIELFEYFGIKDIYEDLTAPQIYRMMVEKAFGKNMQGEHVESLRRCFNALMSCSVLRMTREWDDLISFPIE